MVCSTSKACTLLTPNAKKRLGSLYSDVAEVVRSPNSAARSLGLVALKSPFHNTKQASRNDRVEDCITMQAACRPRGVRELLALRMWIVAIIVSGSFSEITSKIIQPPPSSDGSTTAEMGPEVLRISEKKHHVCVALPLGAAGHSSTCLIDLSLKSKFESFEVSHSAPRRSGSCELYPGFVRTTPS